METSKRISFKIGYREFARDVEDKSMQVEEGKFRLYDLLRSLEALGCEVMEVPTSAKNATATEVVIEYPTVEAAEHAMKRGGRHAYALPVGSRLHGMTAGEAREWLAKHKVEEGARAMGVSVSQFYRRRRKLQQAPRDAKIEDVFAS